MFKNFTDETIYNQVMNLHYRLFEEHHWHKMSEKDGLMIKATVEELVSIANLLFSALEDYRAIYQKNAAELARLGKIEQATRTYLLSEPRSPEVLAALVELCRACEVEPEKVIGVKE